jgi:hypothetical protein
MNRIRIIIFSFILINISGLSQETKYYHKFKTSSSFIRLTEWRVNFENKGEKYIIETVDSLNRVEELRLIVNGDLYRKGCYNVAIIKFEYKNDSIIQYNMLDDLSYSTGIECGDVSKTVYILENDKIKKSIDYIFYDEYLNSDYDLEPDFRTQLENDKEKNKDGFKGHANFVWGYQFSSSKYKGFLPVRDSFAFEEKEWWHYPYIENNSKSEFAIQNSQHLHNKNKNE